MQRTFLFTGSFNVNCLLDHHQTLQFKLLLQRFGLSNSIHEPTNFTIPQGSCIDLIITNNTGIVFDNFVIPPCFNTHSKSEVEVTFHIMKQYAYQKVIRD